jgi:di/tricarboxylate transporter
MQLQAWLMLGILVVMFALLVWDRFPSWLVFMGALTVAMTLRLAPPDALLNGFGNTGVITVAALFPVAAGMYATGAVSLLSQYLIGLPKTLMSAQLKVLPPVAVGSAFLNNTPLVAMMIPVVRDLARTTGLPGSKLFMGLSFASILGGICTLIGTSVNLIIAGLVADAIAAGQLLGMKPLTIFDPARVGLPAALAGLVFMIFVGQRMLPGLKREDSGDVVRRMYRCEFRVEANSNLEGKTLEQAGFAQPVGYRLLSITRSEEPLDLAPGGRLQGGDVLAFSAPTDILTGLWTTIGLVPAHATAMATRRHQHRLVELVASSKAFAIGHCLSDLPRSDIPYEMMLVGLSRNGEAPEQPLGEIRVKPGDAGVVEVNDAFFYENRREIDFTLTKRLEGYRVQRVDRAMLAMAITVAMVALAAFGVTSMLNAALLATMAMLFTGCVTSKRVWNSLDWQTIVVLGAAVGLASAVTASGLSQVIADWFTAIGGRNPGAALIAVFVGTVVMTNVVTNAAAASFMFPVALSLAARLGVNFMPFAVILMVGASCAFINPAGFQTNLMVQGPGGYRFNDFAKVGFPLTVIVGIVVLALAPIVYGF